MGCSLSSVFSTVFSRRSKALKDINPNLSQPPTQSPETHQSEPEFLPRPLSTTPSLLNLLCPVRYCLITKRGTPVETFNELITKFPDKGQGIQSVYSDSQMYISMLNVEDVRWLKELVREKGIALAFCQDPPVQGFWERGGYPVENGELGGLEIEEHAILHMNRMSYVDGRGEIVPCSFDE